MPRRVPKQEPYITVEIDTLMKPIVYVAVCNGSNFIVK